MPTQLLIGQNSCFLECCDNWREIYTFIVYKARNYLIIFTSLLPLFFTHSLSYDNFFLRSLIILLSCIFTYYILSNLFLSLLRGCRMNAPANSRLKLPASSKYPLHLK